ncbi:hypothetical protein [Roseateles sp. BYS87W]|uniref:Uncharacterized protein n=1 Tax=Pelomonas baiyunensis TaxID=3299026 RepID=A0ABW7H2H1_9BURK
MSARRMWAAGGAAAVAVLAWAAWQGYGLGAPAPAAADAASAPGASGSHLALPQAAAAASAAPSVAEATPTAASGAALATLSPAEPGFGSAGYAPLVQRALDSGDPEQALEAARRIAGCNPERDVEAMLNGTHPKYRIVMAQSAQTEMINKERQNQRYCQTLTPELRAQYPALVARALEAKVPGAGLAYYDSLNRETRTPAELARALQALRADAEHGEEMVVPLMVLQDLGQSRVERAAYTRLMDLLILKNVLPPLNGLTPPKPADPPYSAQEQSEAAALVKRLWPRFERRG